MTSPLVVDEANVSLAWAKALTALRDAPGHRVAPMIVTFEAGTNNGIAENAPVRAAIDSTLRAIGEQRVQTVSNTIFPAALWRRAKGDRQTLYTTYLENLPHYVEMAPKKNAKGLYFARMIAFNVNHRTGDRDVSLSKGPMREDGNQLEFVISRMKRGVRASAFQVSIFDPRRDHSAAAQLGFPCLQHVTLVPNFEAGTISINGFYATQQMLVKGYGNYLGIARLGAFVAGQVGLTIARVTCYVGVAKMDDPPALSQLTMLYSTYESALAKPALVGATGV